jgi:hypothetical protein
LVVWGLVSSVSASFAQRTCYTVPYNHALQSKGTSKNPDEDFERWMSLRLKERIERKKNSPVQPRPFKSQSQALAQATRYRIPVVVHVIHDTSDDLGEDSNISDAQIQSQVDVLNEDYNRYNADLVNTPAEFELVSGCLNVEFILATEDPNGNPTNGIVRIPVASNNWNPDNQDAALKALSYWPAEDYLNIWVTRLAGNTLGYAQFPESNLPGLDDEPENRLTDGVVIHYRAFGKGNPNLFDEFNLGRTATHEVGHFFGLRHIWGDNNSCFGNEDFVDDTPSQLEETTGCPSHPQVSCNSNKMFQNYMDYTDDACYNLFTQGQVERMITVLEESPRRNSLLTSHALPAPPPTVNDVALIKIIYPIIIECSSPADITFKIRNAGTESIQNFDARLEINNQVLTGEVTLTEPILGCATITAQNITFGEGSNQIELLVNNPNNQTDAVPQNGLASKTISFNSNSLPVPFRQNFNTSTGDWVLVNPAEGTGWDLQDTNFGRSVRFHSFSTGSPQDQAWLVSPSLDLRSAAQAGIYFDYAHSSNNGETDQLQVFITKDCGQTFEQALDLTSNALITALDPFNFTPTTTADWYFSTSSVRNNYISLKEFVGEENVQIAFVATNGQGNNIYIDNIEFYFSDTFPAVRPSNEYVVYSSGNSFNKLTFNLPDLQDVNIEVIDLQGRLIKEEVLQHVLNQTYRLDLNDVQSGLYLIRIQTAQSITTSKILLRK